MELIKKIILNLGAKGLSVLFVLLFNLYIARELDVSDYGMFVLMQIITLGLSIYAQSGMQMAYMRFVMEVKSNQISQIVSITLLCFKIVKTRLIHALIVYFIFSGVLIFLNINISVLLFICFLLYLIVQTYIFILIAWYRSQQKSYLSSFLEQGVYSMLSLMALITYEFLFSDLSLNTVSIAFSLSSLLSLLGFAYKPFMLFTNTKDKKVIENECYFRSVSSNLMIMNVSNFVLVWFGVWISGFILSVSDVAYLGAAQRLAQVITFLLIGFNGVVAPLFSKLYSTGAFDDLEKLAKHSAWYMFIFNIPIVLVLVLYGELLLSFFGTEFVVAYPYLLIILIGQFVNVLTGSVGFLLSMVGYDKIVKNIVIVSGGASVLMSVTLGYWFGVVGVSLSISLGIAMNNLLLAYLVYKKLGFVLVPFLQWMK
jgi:O-antigen/teichoic acid export membrane protein